MAGFIRPFPLLRCDSGDGQNFTLAGPLWYLSRSGDWYCIPEGSTTDGPSIPQHLLSVISPFGKIWLPAIGHDSGWRGTLLKWSREATKLIPANHDAQALTNLFREMMEIQQMSESEITAVFEAVQRFGEPCFVDDLKNPLPEYLVIPKELPTS